MSQNYCHSRINTFLLSWRYPDRRVEVLPRIKFTYLQGRRSNIDNSREPRVNLAWSSKYLRLAQPDLPFPIQLYKTASSLRKSTLHLWELSSLLRVSKSPELQRWPTKKENDLINLSRSKPHHGLSSTLGLVGGLAIWGRAEVAP